MPLAEVSAILELAPLERFVFVMSVLERYSEHDCSTERLSGPKASRLVIDMAITRYFATLGWNPSLSQ